MRCVFVSRIHPKKNILYFLKLLKDISRDIQIDIDLYGYVDDEMYFEKCKMLMDDLPPNITYRFNGSLKNDLIFKTISKYHLFVLPTLGENFGHAIFEAMGAGRPVLISDQTPWRQLEDAKLGWDIALSQPRQFTVAIKTAAYWTQEEFDIWCRSSYNYAHKWANKSSVKELYINLFS